MLPKDTSAIRELLDSYGISQESEKILEDELLTGNPFEVDIHFPKTESKATKVSNELLYGIGLELDLDDNDEENDADVIYEDETE